MKRYTKKQQAKAERLLAENPMPEGAPVSFGAIASSLREQVDAAVAGAFDSRAEVIDPGDADFRHPPPLVDDPSIRVAERAERDAARAPYRAPDAVELAFTRIPTTGDDQLSDVVAALSGLRAEDCFGVYRVPDRYDERRRHENKAYMEWEIAHADGAGTATQQTVDMTGFNREDSWVGRQEGELPVLDEEMIGVLVARGGLEPRDCYGLARMLELRADSIGEGTSSPDAYVRGVLAVTRRELGPVQRELAAAAPLDVGPPPFTVVTLDWEAVMAWNAPKRRYPPRVPAPLPHLPGDPQELLAAYLEIVGISPQDCYGAMVTRTTDGGSGDLGPAGISRGARLPSFACTDGRTRSRHDNAEHVVVLHRDSSEYAAGRERWAAYEADVLRARLVRSLPPGEPMRRRERRDDPFLFQVLNMFNPLDPMAEYPTIFNRHEVYRLGPYC